MATSFSREMPIDSHPPSSSRDSVTVCADASQTRAAAYAPSSSELAR